MKKTSKIIPKKSLGQNFLINTGVQQRIIAACNLNPTDTILEIGPGKGALTHLIAPHVKNVIAVEKDPDLVKLLKTSFKDTNVEIINEDILKYPFESLKNNTKIIGNLPYNISSSIIEKSIFTREKISEFYMTVQLEFGQRLVAKANTSAYGRLSCFVQYYSDAKMLFKIRNTSFWPAPKVQSCFLKLNFKNPCSIRAKNEKLLFKTIQTCFAQRRKMLRNSLSSLINKDQVSFIFKDLNIDPKARAENISLSDFIHIADYLGEPPSQPLYH